MKLKKLEIQGFKSFAEKTEIIFEEGTTAIVGPNGSGKSNISDAVRWVLGEQSAKQLRGARMEDIIFGGTEKRKPLAWCEVALLFDNEDRALAMDCAEVLVTRRVWRSGESEYYLNKAACRLKDITSLFRDTGIGKDGYSLIGQGRIDEILSTKSDDRREVFEEAAGIVTYRARKDEAERRMENTRLNLNRVEDILSELEDQLGPLREQAEEAKRYLAMRDQLRDLELNAFLVSHERLEASVKKQEELIALIDRELEQAAPRIASIRELLDGVSGKLEEAESEDGALSTAVLESARALEAQEGANNVLRERISNAETVARRESALQQEETLRAVSLEKLKTENATDEKLRSEILAEAWDELMALEELLRTAQAESSRQEEALEAHKAAVIRAMNRMSDMRQSKARLTGLQQSLTERLSEAEQSARAIDDGRGELSDAHADAKFKLAATESDLARLDAEARQLDEMVQASAQESDSLIHRLREKTGIRHEAASRLKVLREMERDYEGYQHAVRHALKHARGDASVRGVVASILKTPKEYERALDMVLGHALQHIITDDEHAAKRMIEYLRDNRFGRATFLPLTTVRGRTMSAQEREALAMHGCVGVASELVRYDPEYRNIVENLLGRTVIADSLDNGIQIMRHGRHAFRLVTLDGDVMHSGGSMTGGSVQSSMTSLLSREREIGEHEELLETLSRELNETQDRVDALEVGRAEAKRQRNALFESAHQAEIAVARDQAHEARARESLENHDEQARNAQQLVEQIRANLDDVADAMRRAEEEQEGGELDQEGMQRKTAALQSALYEARDRAERLREDETLKRISVTSQERELEAVRREGERLISEEGRLTTQQETREEDIRARERSLSRDRDALLEGEEDRKRRMRALETARAEQTACAEKRRALLASHRDMTAQLEAARKEYADSEEKKHRTELLLVRAQSELAGIQERVWNDYELTYAGAVAFRREDFALAQSQQMIASIRAEIREMGSVNVNAVEDFIAKQERFEDLSTQKQDLLKATADLENIIGELLIKMEKRFRQRFRQLNEFFGETFRMLFGGGSAELKLSDDADILNCNI
ncbi:MAG: chromosome segregation protein SMC, partial [Clostridia bacterium]|nr:chromosome segregation protein SMC [Clostridia bacterium]